MPCSVCCWGCCRWWGCWHYPWSCRHRWVKGGAEVQVVKLRRSEGKTQLMTPEKYSQWLKLQDKKGIKHRKHICFVKREDFLMKGKSHVKVFFDAYQFFGLVWFYCFLFSPDMQRWSRCAHICKTNKVGEKRPSWHSAWLCVSGFMAQPLNLTNNPMGALPLNKLAIRLLTSYSTLDLFCHLNNTIKQELRHCKDRPHNMF